MTTKELKNSVVSVKASSLVVSMGVNGYPLHNFQRTESWGVPAHGGPIPKLLPSILQEGFKPDSVLTVCLIPIDEKTSTLETTNDDIVSRFQASLRKCEYSVKRLVDVNDNGKTVQQLAEIKETFVPPAKMPESYDPAYMVLDGQQRAYCALAAWLITGIDYDVNVVIVANSGDEFDRVRANIQQQTAYTPKEQLLIALRYVDRNPFCTPIDIANFFGWRHLIGVPRADGTVGDIIERNNDRSVYHRLGLLCVRYPSLKIRERIESGELPVSYNKQVLQSLLANIKDTQAVTDSGVAAMKTIAESTGETFDYKFGVPPPAPIIDAVLKSATTGKTLARQPITKAEFERMLIAQPAEGDVRFAKGILESILWGNSVRFNEFLLWGNQTYASSFPIGKEPTTVEPTTVEPTTVEPTTVEPTKRKTTKTK